MVSNRIFVVAAASMFAPTVVACGSSSSESAIVPAGTHYGYVVSKTTAVAAQGHLPTELGLDLGSKTSATPDGKVENQLGQALVALSGLGFGVQATLDTAVNQGTIILLLDFQTKDFVNTGNAGLDVRFGAMPVPAACSSPADTTCGNHLKGDATFQIAANSPTDGSLGGKIVNGTFNSDAGNLTLEITLGSTTPIALNLLHARAKATSISETGIMSANLGGLLTVDDLTNEVAPAIKVQVDAILAANCPANGLPPGCGCTGNTATLIATQIDGSDGTLRDCKISVAELLNYSLVKSLLQPDSCSKASCTAPDSLSVGVQVEAVKAAFPM